MSNPKTITIVGGGGLSKRSLARIVESGYVIGVDRGAYWLIANGVLPNIAIGDFDSVTASELQTIKLKVQCIVEHPREKDFTDMELAIDHALSRKPKEVIIYGAIGSRFDHTMGNIQLLEKLLEKGIPAVIRDNNNEARLTNGRLTLLKERRYRYISLLPITKTIEVTLTGFLYDVSRALIRRGETLGVSNEIKEKEAVIEIHRGKALVMRSRD